MNRCSRFLTLKSIALSAVVGTFVALPGCAESGSQEAVASDALVANINDLPGLAWRNVVNIAFPPGYLTTMGAPNVVLRPSAGNYVRVSIPNACGATLTELALYSPRGTEGFTRVASDNNSGGNNVSYYHINDDQSITLGLVGATLYSLFGCTFSVEQAKGYDWVPPVSNRITMADCVEAQAYFDDRGWGNNGSYIGAPADGSAVCNVVLTFPDAAPADLARRIWSDGFPVAKNGPGLQYVPMDFRVIGIVRAQAAAAD